MFSEKGFDATTVEDIATAAGLSVRTTYRYFPFKEDIVFFDLPDLLAQLQATLADVPESADAWESVTTALRTLSRTQTGHDPAVTQARIRLWFTDPALRSRYLELFQPWEEAIGEFLTRRRNASRGRKEGRGKDTVIRDDLDAQVTAASILAAMRAAYRGEVLHGGDFDGYLDRAFQLLADGLR